MHEGGLYLMFGRPVATFVHLSSAHTVLVCQLVALRTNASPLYVRTARNYDGMLLRSFAF